MAYTTAIEIHCDWPTCSTSSFHESMAAARVAGWKSKRSKPCTYNGHVCPGTVEHYCPEHAECDPEGAQDYREELASERTYRAGYEHACGYVD